ncbi:hypothetical protein Tco_0800090 [Tanacetum coccineum]|uniref:F-box domain-containing protein n=1 Tax=Tanacetum coccineum TaxID=301880 RepID=A0ABQ4ZT60_9ASTR
MDTTVCHEEASGQTSYLYIVPVTVILEITSAFTTTIPPPPPSFNPLLQQATPTPTPTSSEVTTSFPTLPDFTSIFKFNDRVTNLERDLEEALADRREYIDVVDTSARAIIKEEVNSQLPRILPQTSSSQPKSTYEAATSLSEFKRRMILMDNMEEHKSYLRSDYKRVLYDALVKSYNTNKDLFDTYVKVFTLKRSRDDKDKDQDPSARSDRGKKRRKSSKDTSQVIQLVTQEFDTGNNDEQLDVKAASKVDWFKKLEQPPTPDPDWNKRQHVDFRPPQTRISNIARAKNPPTSFDELMDTPIDFYAFIMNRFNITNLTQELLIGPTFNLLKGTYKSRTELEYHFEECFKATTKRLDWHNPKGKQYMFDIRKPLPLIPNHRGRHVIPFDYFINNDLEYPKGGSLSKKYSTFLTKTKAATYVGPKRQQFYGFARNKMSSKDVYSRKRIIAVTSLKIMKRYDYGHLDKIEVCREDQHLYNFKEGDFP